MVCDTANFANVQRLQGYGLQVGTKNRWLLCATTLADDPQSTFARSLEQRCCASTKVRTSHLDCRKALKLVERRVIDHREVPRRGRLDLVLVRRQRADAITIPGCY